MKRLILTGMILTSFVMQGCGDSETKTEVTKPKPKLSKAEIAIKNYYTKGLGDPDSYSVVSSPKLSSEGVKELYKHTFRARNKYNALELKTEYVYYDFFDNKVIIAVPEDTFTGYKQFLKSYANFKSGGDLYQSLFINGIFLDKELVAIQNKDEDTMIKLAKKYLKYNDKYYDSVIAMGKYESQPYISLISTIITLYRFAPQLTAVALIDAN